MAFSGTGKIWMNGRSSTGRTRRSTSRRTSSTTAARCSRARGATPRRAARPASGSMRTCGASTISAKIYRMEPAIDQATLTDAVLETIRANEFKACYIRPIVYRGYYALGVNSRCLPGRLPRSLTWEWGAYLGRRRARAAAPTSRQLLVALGAEHLSDAGEERPANYANSRSSRWKRSIDGYSEGIALDTSGYLSEGSGRTSSWSATADRLTPPLGLGLPGIPATRSTHARRTSVASQRKCCRASCSTSRTRRSSSARPWKSRRSARWTRSRWATAGAGRSPKRSSAFFEVINGEHPRRHRRLADLRLIRAIAAGRRKTACRRR